ncbi:HtaA domain-containing protein [Streptomyces kunmingensis]|uniref:HtaA domain-containing protein n=1 Tax=Streptomyces kunmingensis TaxID=68225 RepID=A0ABU6C4N1_9ACTN|nr:HtaA domain-containing protein [Streptomyces kunmingensis]MEB3959678.1 HtaA domain-containing protein [Streptomyces kunmingensis]
MSLIRHPMALAAATAVALGAGALALPAFAAEKAPAVELKNGTLDWGVKDSFRKYVTGIAAGKIEATDGATQAAENGVFTFSDGAGTYDTTTHGTDTAFKGAVRFVSTAHMFDIKISDVQVVTSGTSGHIDADVSLNGEVQNDIEFAALDLSAVKPGQGAGGAMTFKDIPATLTADGAEAFNGMYEAGTALDAATLTVTAATSSPNPDPSTTPPTTPPVTSKPTATPTGRPTATASTSPKPGVAPFGNAASGAIADGNLDWGVKESFRTYITGPIAKGKVELTGGAAKNGSVYRFGDASGSYDAAAKSLDAKFAGKLRFLGHEEAGTYVLDLQFSDLHVTAKGGSGKLVADVSSKDQESGKVTTYADLTVATLKVGSGDLTAKDDVVELDGAAATLTADGAKAFGGFYQAGAALDPVEVAVSLDEDATLPSGSGSDGGTSGGTSGGTTGGAGTTGSTNGGTGSTTGGSLAATGADVPAGPLAAAAALVVAAGAGTVYATRRRRSQES